MWMLNSRNDLNYRFIVDNKINSMSIEGTNIITQEANHENMWRKMYA